jgi:hypothetical protein
MTTAKAGTPPRRRQGSDKRQRAHVVRIPLLPAERHEIENAAAKAGMTLSAYARAKTLGAMPPRDGKHLQVSREALDALLPELRKIGKVLNSVARAVNMNAAGASDYDEALRQAGELSHGHAPLYCGARASRCKAKSCSIVETRA